MTLLLSDRNWEQLGREVTPRGTIYHARYKRALERCPVCEASSLSKYGSNTANYVDVPIGDQPTILRAKIPRFLCAACKQTVSAKPEGLSESHRLTEKCHEYILAIRYRYARVEIARMTGLHQSTVTRILSANDVEKSEAQLSGTTPVCTSNNIQIKRYVPSELAIDEINLGRRKYITLIDRSNSRLLDILETEGTEKSDCAAIDRFFEVADNVEYYSAMEFEGELHEGIEYEVTPNRITMDMCHTYRSYFYKRFPESKIVIDRWHVEKAFTKRFRKILTRTLGMRAEGLLPCHGVEFGSARFHAHKNSVLYAKFANICPKAATKDDGSAGLNKLRRLLLAHPHIIPAWEHRQRFNQIWLSQNRQDAEKQFIKWRVGIPDEFAEYKEFVEELEKWCDVFFNYFDGDPRRRVTNAIAESTNKMIRACYNRRKGIGNLDEFRNAAFAESIKNKSTATCVFCGDVCFQDLADTTDVRKYLNHRQLKSMGRPRKNWNVYSNSLLEVVCEQCRVEESSEDSLIIADRPIKNCIAADEPVASRDLDDFLDELRNDPRYRDWVCGGKKLSPVPVNNKKRPPETHSDNGQQGVLQFD